MSVDDYRRVASVPLFRRYKAIGYRMVPDNERGGWVLLSDALAAQEQARREERERIAEWLETWGDSVRGMKHVGPVLAGTLERMAESLYDGWLEPPKGKY